MPSEAGRRGCGPLIVLSALMTIIIAGGYVVAGPLKTPRLVIARGVSIELSAGWEFVERTAGDQPGVEVTNGTGSLGVALVPGDDDPLALATAYIDEVLRPQAGRLAIAGTVQRPRVGVHGVVVRVSYSGVFGERPVSFEGTVSALMSGDRQGIVFDGWADQGQYGSVDEDVLAMIESTRWR